MRLTMKGKNGSLDRFTQKVKKLIVGNAGIDTIRELLT